MKEYKFIIDEENDNTRIDLTLSELIPDKSRSYIQKLIKSGEVLLNNNIVKPSTLLHIDDELLCNIPDSVIPEIKPENIPLNIVYEDKDILIVNKPKNMVVHPANGHYDGTLVNALMFHCDDLSGINGVMRPGIVHRIDKDTTGLLIVCKNDESHNFISEQLKVHSIERTYHALVHGVIKEDTGVINMPIGRDEKDRLKMAVNYKNGKDATTCYTVLKRFSNATYVKLNLKTGRTHQIRVHMSTMGYPLYGDNLYGKKNDKYLQYGQFLHAKTIGFIHPTTKEMISFDSDIPEYFKEVLEKLR